MKPVVVIGCDPSSTKIALVVTVDDAAPAVFKRRLPTRLKDTPRQLFLARRWIRRIIAMYPNAEVHFFVENPFVSPKTIRAVLPLSRMHGVLQEAAYACDIELVQGVDISRWKKAVVGTGNASKPDIKQWVKDAWPEVYELTGGDQDLCDAACINRYGSKVVKTAAKMKRQANMEEVVRCHLGPRRSLPPSRQNSPRTTRTSRS